MKQQNYSVVIENLTYTYMKGTPFEKKALDNVSLRIEKGQFVSIIGHTGSGKSTLIQHLNGLLKPEKGKVIVNGIDTCCRELKSLRRQVGVVFQYPEHQLFEENVYKDIAFGILKQGMTQEQIDIRVRKAICDVGLDETVLNKSPFEISGGQKRKVAIAGVLVMEPDILVLDEPTAGLDPKARDDIFSIIKDLHRSRKITIILVSHNMEDVAKYASRIVVMNKGKIEMDGKISEVFSDIKRLESIGLSAPQITYLMHELSNAMPFVDKNVFTVEDALPQIIKILSNSKKTKPADGGTKQC